MTKSREKVRKDIPLVLDLSDKRNQKCPAGSAEVAAVSGAVIYFCFLTKQKPMAPDLGGAQPEEHR